jgi:hypothetical protein
MPAEDVATVIRFWEWLRANDLPNWVAIAFSLIVWPAVIFLWQRRRVSSVAGLEVHFFRGSIQINGKDFSAVDVRFTNHTGAVVYVRGVRVRDCTAKFPVPLEAARDVSSNSYHLKFNYGDGAFVHREVTLQTTESAQSCMPVGTSLSDAFFVHVQPWYLRLIRRQTYFVLEYTALVGSSRYLVSTRY